MNLGERLKKLRGDENQTTFGSRFGASRNTVMRYESGERTPDAAFIAALCKHYGVNPSWLLLGEGSLSLRGDNGEASTSLAEAPAGYVIKEPVASDGLDVATKKSPHQGGDFHLSMGDSMELLVNIHKSGNNVLIRAINANLMAFNEAIENRGRAEIAINAISELREQMRVINGEIADLRQENQDLRQKILSRDDREQGEAAG